MKLMRSSFARWLAARCLRFGNAGNINNKFMAINFFLNDFTYRSINIYISCECVSFFKSNYFPHVIN